MRRTKTGLVALSGVLAAASVGVRGRACVTPSGQAGVTAAAGLFPVGAVLSAGRGAGLLCWGAASILGLLLLPDKGVALMYLVFFGLYPVVKSRLEQLKSRPAEWAGKLVFFNAALSLLWFAFQGLLLPNLPEWLTGQVWMLYGAGNLIFILYDVALSRLIGGLSARLRFKGM